MNEIDALPPSDDDLIDRIVDGTLTPGELRAAIDRLERAPDGWKRCAAAFLEAQCWRESFLTLGERAIPQAHGRPVRLPLSVGGASRTVRTCVRGAMAAGIVVASFAIGWLGHASRNGAAAKQTPPGRSTAIVAQHASAAHSPPTTTTVSDGPGPVDSVPPPALEDRFGTDPAELVRTVATLRIGDEAAGTEVPILAGPGITEDWLRQQPPPISKHDQIILQRQGYEVAQRRRLITTLMPDGRRVTVPIDQVLIQYTGNQSL